MSRKVQYQCAYCKFFINSYCEDYMDHIGFSEKLKNLPTNKNYAIVLSGQHNNVLELAQCSISIQLSKTHLLSSSSTPDLLSPTSSTGRETERKREVNPLINETKIEIQKQILKSLHENTTKKPDGIYGSLMLLEEGLRRLPQRNQAKMQIKFLQMLADEE
ncbi:unnamed protein product [Psylliodes chrysocephalus]|uniref:BESS domain-containing protein n=1 Tax=Psylliodes chrysocephalus TaxID=3402493 RepID=A0A9P0GG88_9CUCU|nr:unnamed protein product [Psylliodes chrysocephala]